MDPIQNPVGAGPQQAGAALGLPTGVSPPGRGAAIARAAVQERDHVQPQIGGLGGAVAAAKLQTLGPALAWRSGG